jgi:hypothetical protein
MIKYTTQTHKEQTKITEINKMEDKKESEFIKGAEIIITGVEAIAHFKDEQKIEKVIFKTDKGDITHKPKVEDSNFVESIKVKTKTQPYIQELATVIKDIARICQLKGHCKVKGDYSILTVEKDGQKETYRFVQYPSQLDRWLIIPEPLITEEAIN